MPEITDNAPGQPSWRDQRDKARAVAASHVMNGLRQIGGIEQAIDQQLLIMRDLEMTVGAIAEATGLTPSVVQARCKRASEG